MWSAATPARVVTVGVYLCRVAVVRARACKSRPLPHPPALAPFHWSLAMQHRDLHQAMWFCVLAPPALVVAQLAAFVCW